MSSPSVLNDEVFHASQNACHLLTLAVMPMRLRGYTDSDVSNDEGCSMLYPCFASAHIQGPQPVGQGPQLRTSVLYWYIRSVKTGAVNASEEAGWAVALNDGCFWLQ